MDIREIQALHAQYSSQPVVIDINSHVRALPAPDRQESTRERVTARLSSTGRKLGRPAAIVLAVVAGAGLTGVSTAKLWHALHPPQAVVHVERSNTQTPVTPPAPSAASTTRGSQRPLTSADFTEPAAGMPADRPRVDVQALRTGDADGSAPSASAAAPVTDLERAATSPIRAARAASNPAASQRQVTAVQTPPSTPPAATSAPVAAPPTAQPTELPKPAPRRLHRAPVRPRQEPATTEATAATPHNEPTKTEHSPKSSTPAKTGDVPLF